MIKTSIECVPPCKRFTSSHPHSMHIRSSRFLVCIPRGWKRKDRLLLLSLPVLFLPPISMSKLDRNLNLNSSLIRSSCLSVQTKISSSLDPRSAMFILIPRYLHFINCTYLHMSQCSYKTGNQGLSQIELLAYR